MNLATERKDPGKVVRDILMERSDQVYRDDRTASHGDSIG
jgi:hypothetical protein